VSKKAKGVLVGVTAAIVLLVCCGVGSSALSNMGGGAPDNPIPAPASSAPVADVTVSPSDSVTVDDQAAANSSKTSISDGQWQIGIDKRSGKYLTAGGDGCYWELTTLAGAEPGDAGYVDNGLPNGRAFLTLKAGEYFTTSNCGTWTLVP
jgi:hypothetical protein